MITYSEDFTARLKKVYGAYSLEHNLALNCDEKLGVLLKNKIIQGISYEQIFKAKSLKSLQDLASTNINMYEFWYDEMLNAYGDDRVALDHYLHSNDMYLDVNSLESGKSAQT